MNLSLIVIKPVAGWSVQENLLSKVPIALNTFVWWPQESFWTSYNGSYWYYLFISLLFLKLNASTGLQQVKGTLES